MASAARANTPDEGERAILDEARRLYKERERVPCTTCGYCQPCPSGVPIPEVFGMYNAASMFDTRKGTGRWYKHAFLSDGQGRRRLRPLRRVPPQVPSGHRRSPIAWRKPTPS